MMWNFSFFFSNLRCLLFHHDHQRKWTCVVMRTWSGFMRGGHRKDFQNVRIDDVKVNRELCTIGWELMIDSTQILMTGRREYSLMKRFVRVGPELPGSELRRKYFWFICHLKFIFKLVTIAVMELAWNLIRFAINIGANYRRIGFWRSWPHITNSESIHHWWISKF